MVKEAEAGQNADNAVDGTKLPFNVSDPQNTQVLLLDGQEVSLILILQLSEI